MTEQKTSTSCFKYEVPLTPLEELKRGNRILLTLFNIKQEQIQKMADELFGSSELSKPVFKRGVHFNEASNQYAAEPIDFDDLIAQQEQQDQEQDQEQEQQDQEDQEQQEEPDPDTKAQIREYLLEQEQEQEQDDLVWSEFGHRWVTQKDYNTFEVKVEPIIIKQEPVNKQEPVKIKLNLFEKLLQKYKKKADKINAIIERQEKERQEAARQQEQEQDNFCESDHEDMREELWPIAGLPARVFDLVPGDTVDCLLSAESVQNTFYDFAELADCFEEIDEEEQEQEQKQKQKKKQQNPDQCNCQEDQEEQCEECQKKPPKKLQRSEECDTLPPLIVL